MASLTVFVVFRVKMGAGVMQSLTRRGFVCVGVPTKTRDCEAPDDNATTEERRRGIRAMISLAIVDDGSCMLCAKGNDCRCRAMIWICSFDLGGFG